MRKHDMIKKNCKYLCFCISIFIITSIVACSMGGNEFIGKWNEKNVITMIISKNSSSFLVDIKTSGFVYGKYVAKLTGAGLEGNFGMAGHQVITYDKNSDTLEFGGSKLKRVK